MLFELEPERRTTCHRATLWLNVCGGVAIASYGARTLISHSLDDFSNRSRARLSLGLLLASTASPLVLLLLARLRTITIGARESRLALVFALGFALLCAPARPLGADFWYYVAEGRLALTGADPYTQKLSAAELVDLPVGAQSQGTTMMYGPAWVWVSTLLSSLGGGHRSTEFALYKAFLLSLWVANLVLVYRALAASPRHQFIAVLILGWMPLSVIESVAEGHNDIAMVVLMTGWLVSRGVGGSAWLAASVLVKYVTVPLLGIAAIAVLVRRSAKGAFLLTGAVLAVGIVLARYWHDGALIASLRGLSGQRLLSPAAVARWLVRSGDLPSNLDTLSLVAWRVLLVSLVAWYAWKYIRKPSQFHLYGWVTATILAMVLGADRVWPWYATWILPSLALSLDGLLLLLALPLVVLMPVAQVLYMWGSVSFDRVAALLFFVVAISWMLAFGILRASGADLFRRVAQQVRADTV